MNGIHGYEVVLHIFFLLPLKWLLDFVSCIGRVVNPNIVSYTYRGCIYCSVGALPLVVRIFATHFPRAASAIAQQQQPTTTGLQNHTT